MVSGNNNVWVKRRISYSDVTRKMFHPAIRLTFAMISLVGSVYAVRNIYGCSVAFSKSYSWLSQYMPLDKKVYLVFLFGASTVLLTLSSIYIISAIVYVAIRMIGSRL